MSIEHIKAAYDKGHSPPAIALLLGHDIEYVNNVLGIVKEDTTRPVSNIPYSEESLETLSAEALFKLVILVHDNPDAFKPPEALAIIREGLDRTRGRAQQTVKLDQRVQVTHDHVMSLEPAEAYRLMTSGTARLTGLPVIDVTPEGGGDTVDGGVGVDVGEGAPDTTHKFWSKLT
jgi:hypothetical protein